MRILHITFALDCGGVETFLVSLANRQSRCHDVEVCTISCPSPADMARRGLLPSVRQSDAGKHNLPTGFRAMARIARKIRRGGYDIVHVHGQFYYYLLPVLTAPRGTRFVYTVHNDAARENSRWDRIFTRLKRCWFRSGRLNAVTISESSKRSFEEYYGKDTSSTLICNGIEAPVLPPVRPDSLARWRLSPQTKVLINPGRLYKQKNQVELCKAFADLLSRPDAPDVQLLIAGPAEIPAIHESIKPYLCDRIMYLGAQEQLPRMLADADAMIMPSLWEGMPIALLECLAVGGIPICTRAGGMADVVAPGKCGIVIESPAAADIAAAVRKFAAMDGNALEMLRRRSREAFARYDMAGCCERYLSLYEAILR